MAPSIRTNQGLSSLKFDAQIAQIPELKFPDSRLSPTLVLVGRRERVLEKIYCQLRHSKARLYTGGTHAPNNMEQGNSARYVVWLCRIVHSTTTRGNVKNG
jgi:hypothetical protein